VGNRRKVRFSKRDAQGADGEAKLPQFQFIAIAKAIPVIEGERHPIEASSTFTGEMLNGQRII
jgi:hypothetical protein